ncbi:exonuclease V a 5' deoxyribonuclease-domain-containing protein [Lyophyllum atratum]|nr:exonuclease V a 5' deoxyribonuclease-domain-containing protein [Lyophyllum atratum]
MSDDEYAAFDFSEFTEDDLQQIDADLIHKAKAGPKITIELESSTLEDNALSQSADASTSAGKTRERATDSVLSPLQQYRRGGVLTVTDLASLAWCEVQFDYGLRQRRSRPIASRPASFVSARGKEIVVEKAVAANNDKRIKQGQAIHKRLELEIRPEEVLVNVTSEEEQWALRLLNMVSSVQCILLEGFTREMNVFGVIHNEVVVGIIDEVVRLPQLQPVPQKRHQASSPTTPKSKRPRRSMSPSQPSIAEFFPGPSTQNTISAEGDSESSIVESASPLPLNTSTIPSAPSQIILHLIDTKTRRSNSLPSHQDSFPSRIQLMLYYRLLRDLISTSPPFDFGSFWRRLDVNPSASFSTQFLVQARLTAELQERTTSCLNDLAQAWTEMVQVLNVCDVDTSLEIIYRLQPPGSKWKSRNRGKGKTHVQNSVNSMTQEELDLARAIEASLRDLAHDPSRESPDILKAAAANEVVSVLTSVGESPPPPKEGSLSEKDIVAIVDSNGHSHPNEIDVPLPDAVPHKGFNENLEVYDLSIIGVKKFIYEEQLLSNHLTQVLQWWHGEREPQGVSLQDAGRCRSCEYEAHCEWREQKAQEMKERIQR